MIRYKEVIGKRVNPFDNKNVAKRAIIALHFLDALFFFDKAHILGSIKVKFSKKQQ